MCLELQKNQQNKLTNESTIRCVSITKGFLKICADLAKELLAVWGWAPVSKHVFKVIIFRYIRFIYLHCGEETNIRDPHS